MKISFLSERFGGQINQNTGQIFRDTIENAGVERRNHPRRWIVASNPRVRRVLIPTPLSVYVSFLQRTTKSQTTRRATCHRDTVSQMVSSSADSRLSEDRYGTDASVTVRSHQASSTASESRSDKDHYRKFKQQFHEFKQHYGRKLEQYRQRNEQLKAENDTLKKDREVGRAAAARMREQLAVLQEQLQHERSLREQDRKLLELRRVELEEARAFLGSADAASGEEITSMVRALNSDVSQLAASIAESGDFLDEYQCDQAVVDQAQKFFGRGLCDLLYACRTENSERREFIVQITLQAVLLWSISHIISRWTPHLRQRGHSVLEGVYEGVRSSYPRGAGRWRAMTRSSFKYEHPHDVITEATARFTLAVSLVLRIAGHKHMIDHPDSFVTENFGEALEEIVKTAIHLDRAMGEEMLSQDAKLVMARNEEMFNPEWMEDAYGAGNREDVVVCSLEFGVQFSVPSSREHDVVASPSMKTKVVLVTSLSLLDRSC